MENNPNCLNDLKYTISNGSSHKINKNAIENIFNFLWLIYEGGGQSMSKV